MIKDIYENEVGYMVGTFYADIFGYEMEVWFKKDIFFQLVCRDSLYASVQFF